MCASQKWHALFDKGGDLINYLLACNEKIEHANMKAFVGMKKEEGTCVHENEGVLVLQANRLDYDWCMDSTVHLIFKEMNVSKIHTVRLQLPWPSFSALLVLLHPFCFSFGRALTLYIYILGFFLHSCNFFPHKLKCENPPMAQKFNNTYIPNSSPIITVGRKTNVHASIIQNVFLPVSENNVMGSQDFSGKI